MALLQTARGPLLALLCARPAMLERVPGWGDGLPAHERLALQPLDVPQASALARSLLARLDPVPLELAELIQRRAEGNPFYAEELVGMLLDQGVITADDGATEGPGDWRFHAERLDAKRLPTTLTGVLQRLDALDPQAPNALQITSVIGPVFWDDALQALDTRGPEALPALQRKALVQQRPTSAFDDTNEQAFQHHLLHQVAEQSELGKAADVSFLRMPWSYWHHVQGDCATAPIDWWSNGEGHRGKPWFAARMPGPRVNPHPTRIPPASNKKIKVNEINNLQVTFVLRPVRELLSRSS